MNATDLLLSMRLECRNIGEDWHEVGRNDMSNLAGYLERAYRLRDENPDLWAGARAMVAGLDAGLIYPLRQHQQELRKAS